MLPRLVVHHLRTSKVDCYESSASDRKRRTTMNRETKGTGGGMDWTDERKEKRKKKKKEQKFTTTTVCFCDWCCGPSCPVKCIMLHLIIASKYLRFL